MIIRWPFDKDPFKIASSYGWPKWHLLVLDEDFSTFLNEDFIVGNICCQFTVYLNFEAAFNSNELISFT